MTGTAHGVLPNEAGVLSEDSHLRSLHSNGVIISSNVRSMTVHADISELTVGIHG